MTIHSATASTASLLSAAGGGVDLDFDLSFLGQMVAFSILIVILKPLLFDPLMRLFEERERRTEGARMLARRMDEQAGELLVRYQAEIDAARKAAGKDRERLRAEAAKLESEIVAQTRAEVGKLVEDGKGRIAREAAALRAELTAKSGDIARLIASRLLGREIT